MSFQREADGSLREGHTFASDGRRTGGVTDPLESQGSLTLSQDHSLLFAVNGGRRDFSVSCGWLKSPAAGQGFLRRRRTERSGPARAPRLRTQCCRQQQRGGFTVEAK